MRFYWAAFLLLLSAQWVSAAGGSSTEGGNITKSELNMCQQTDFWAAIVGNLNESPANISSSISVQSTPNRTVYTNHPNGTYADLFNYTMVLARLPQKPNISRVFSPVQSDFSQSGMFANFSIFGGMNFSNNIQSPYFTFVWNWSTTTCYLENVSFVCPYIILQPNIRMAVLKYDNGTAAEPLFLENIINQVGYNGSQFQFEYMVPSLEAYYFYAYKPDFSYVKIITPQPITYSSGNLQLTYIMNDTAGIFNCWYVLDGVKTDMPICGPPYNFTAGTGTHQLFLFANNTAGFSSSDNVAFQVSPPTPPPPPPPPQGGGGTQTPYYPQPPVVPPPPPGMYFSLLPEAIFVTVDYPNEGSSDFTLASTTGMNDLSCSVSGDFGKYSTVVLDSEGIQANGTVNGRVTVKMTPEENLDYEGRLMGTLRCVGKTDPTLISSTMATLNLTINRPALQMDNRTFDMRPGEVLNASTVLMNIGPGNSSAINISATIVSNRGLISIYELPHQLGQKGEGIVRFTIRIPEGMNQSRQMIRINFFENGRMVGLWEGNIMVNVLPPLPKPPVKECSFPDLSWTLAILLAGMAGSVLAFTKKTGMDEERMRKEKIKPLKGWKRFVKPVGWTLSVMLVFFIAWLVIAWMLFRCQ